MNKFEKDQLDQIEKNFVEQANWLCNRNACESILKRAVQNLKYLPDGKIEGLDEVYKYIDKLCDHNKKIQREQNHIRDKLYLLSNPDAEFLFPPTISQFSFSDLHYKHWDKEHYVSGSPKSIKHLEPKS